MQPKNHDQVIHDLMSNMVKAVNYESLANNIAVFFTALLEAELCTLWRRIWYEGEDTLVLSGSIGMVRKPGKPIPTYKLEKDGENKKQIGVTAWIAINKQICLANSYYELTEDISKPWIEAHAGKWDKEQFPDWKPQIISGTGFKNLLGLPIIFYHKLIENDQIRIEEDVIGVLKIESTQSESGFSNDDKELAQRLMPFIAIALKTMDEREAHEQERQQSFRNLTSALLRQDPTTFNQAVVDQTAQMLKADICSLWLVDKREKKLKLGANFGVRSKDKVPEYPLSWDVEDDQIDGLTPWVVIRKRSFYGEEHNDLSSHSSWRGKWDEDQWERKVESNFGCLYAVPLIDVDGNALGVLKIENRFGKPKFDIVDRTTFDLMAEFIALALVFNSRLRADIVYDFFHLLKQPVSNAIMAYSELKTELAGRNRPERINSRMEMLANNLQTVRVWIQNVYGLATAGIDSPDENVESVPLCELLADATTNMKNLFPEFKCNLDGVSSISIKLTQLQRKKIDAILFNLFDNSFKYTDEGHRQISATTLYEDNTLHLSIIDNGIGIHPEDIPRVFEPFFTRGGDSKRPDSLGLGLATVNRLLNELKWGREIKSTVNEGTEFMMNIPKEYIV